MPRRSVNINANENDIIALQKLAAGLDPNLALHAKIILESMNTPTASEVAKKLSIDQRAVSHWKKRFMEDGIEGLRKTYGGGPQPKPVESLTERLAERTSQSKPWTVASLAEEYQTTSYAIRKSLNEAGVEPQRMHTWCCRTVDSTCDKSFSVYALYLSSDTQALVLCSYPTCDSGNMRLMRESTESGTLITRNRLLALDIEQSVSPLSLADTLVAAAKHHHDMLHAKRMDLSSFLESVIRGLPEDPSAEYHVYAHAEEQPRYRGTSAGRIAYSSAKTTEMWKAAAASWIESLTDFTQRQSGSELMKTIDIYLQMCEPSTEPFCWKKEGRTAKMNAGEEKDRIQAAAENLWNQMEAAGNESQVGAVLVIRDENGVSTQEIVSQTSMPKTEDLDYSSPAALGRSLGKAGRAIDSFVRDLALRLEQKYSDDAKKTRSCRYNKERMGRKSSGTVSDSSSHRNSLSVKSRTVFAYGRLSA